MSAAATDGGRRISKGIVCIPTACRRLRAVGTSTRFRSRAHRTCADHLGQSGRCLVVIGIIVAGQAGTIALAECDRPAEFGCKDNSGVDRLAPDLDGGFVANAIARRATAAE